MSIIDKANKYIGHPREVDEGYEVSMRRDAYAQGYQDAIDKACEWIESYLFDIGFPDDWCRDSANLKSGKQRFIEAMEE